MFGSLYFDSMKNESCKICSTSLSCTVPFTVTVTVAHVFSNDGVAVDCAIVTLDEDIVPVVLVAYVSDEVLPVDSDEVLPVDSDEVPLVDAAAVEVATIALVVCVGLLVVVIGPEGFAGVVEGEEVTAVEP